jgi:hypothetical protein
MIDIRAMDGFEYVGPEFICFDYVVSNSIRLHRLKIDFRKFQIMLNIDSFLIGSIFRTELLFGIEIIGVVCNWIEIAFGLNLGFREINNRQRLERPYCNTVRKCLF